MPLDASIYGRFQPRSALDYVGELEQLASMRDQRQDNALARAFRMQQMERGNALQQLQLMTAQADFDARQRREADMRSFIGSIPSPSMTASQEALGGGGGPTVANAQKMRPVDPRLDVLHRGMAAGVVEPSTYLGAAFPAQAAPDYKVVGDSLVKIAPGGVSEAFRSDRQKLPEGMRMGAGGQAEWIPGYLEGRGQVARAGASSTSISYGAPITAINPNTGQAELVRPDNRGGMNFTGIKPPGDGEKALTEGQAKAVLFASRMQASDKVLAQLSRSGVKTTVPGATRNDAIGDVITAASPAEQQQLVQAKRDFINAVLRRESGAVIAADEFANAERQYFPQIGDSRPVIEQKARNRRAAIEGMRADVPKSRQGEVDRISTGGAPAGVDADPLGLRKGK